MVIFTMEMRTTYSIGELAALLGMSAQSIRKYEKLGLITAVRQGNNYRTFDAPDITLLMRIKLYRNLGFSLKDITSLLQDHGAETRMPIFDERLKNLNLEVERLHMLIECAQIQKGFLRDKEENVGRITVSERPAMVCLIYRKVRSIMPYFFNENVLGELLEYMPPFQYMITVDKECYNSDSNLYSVGFAVPEKFLQFVPKTVDMYEIPSRVCVSVLLKHSVRRINGQWENVSFKDEFNKAGIHRFMEENNLTLKGDITGFTHYDTIGPNLFCHYIKYWFPVF